jgi:protein-S-isoprenylcysteine O-methyltransferase Ste14
MIIILKPIIAGSQSAVIYIITIFVVALIGILFLMMLLMFYAFHWNRKFNNERGEELVTTLV